MIIASNLDFIQYLQHTSKKVLLMMSYVELEILIIVRFQKLVENVFFF